MNSVTFIKLLISKSGRKREGIPINKSEREKMTFRKTASSSRSLDEISYRESSTYHSNYDLMSWWLLSESSYNHP